jgi:hypothetical protein
VDMLKTGRKMRRGFSDCIRAFWMGLRAGQGRWLRDR